MILFPLFSFLVFEVCAIAPGQTGRSHSSGVFLCTLLSILVSPSLLFSLRHTISVCTLTVYVEDK